MTVDDVVRDLFAQARAGSKSVGKVKSVRFDGVAWQTGTMAAGTSRLGLSLNDSVRKAAEKEAVTVMTLAEAGSKGLADKLLRGAFSVVKSGVNLSLSLVDAHTGNVISQVRRLVRTPGLAQLAASELVPPDAANTRSLAKVIQQSLGAVKSGFRLTVSTDRGGSAAYFAGDQLHVVVQSERDCYLRLYHMSWKDRSLTLIFPNRSEPDGRLTAGTPVQIPAIASKAVFEVAPPYGVDALVAVASTEPFADDSWVASELKKEQAGAADPWAGQPGSVDPGSEPGSNPDIEVLVGSDDVTREGEFLTQNGLDESGAKGIIAKGLLVRHTDDSNAPANPIGGQISDPGTPYSPDGSEVPPANPRLDSSNGVSTAVTARAVCFFTTLPGSLSAAH